MKSNLTTDQTDDTLHPFIEHHRADVSGVLQGIVIALQVALRAST